jgi:hypothetical protein
LGDVFPATAGGTAWVLLGIRCCWLAGIEPGNPPLDGDVTFDVSPMLSWPAV